jgi:sugar O-acyltransferase (sialic acid O-acetyltransferase NeuD family)
MMQEILLVGGGGHCHSVIDVIEQEKKYVIAGIVDKKERIGERVLGYDIIGSDEDLELLRQRYEFACVSIGHIYSNTVRLHLIKKLNDLAFTLPSIVSAYAYLSPHATVGEGTVIMHHAVINAGAKIGSHCIINSKALIEHDVIIENGCHISTNATLNGAVYVKQNSFIGSGAIAKEGSVLDGFVKAGSLVT